MTAPHWSEQTAGPAPDAAAELPPTALQTLARRVAAVSPTWATVTTPPVAAPDTGGDSDVLGRDRQQGFEAIREGWLLHRGDSRLASDASPDLALLVGDWCYADGLCSIADHGDLDDVAALAALIADVAARGMEPVAALEPRWTEAIKAMHRG